MFNKIKNYLDDFTRLKSYNFYFFTLLLFVSLITLFDTTLVKILSQQLNLPSSTLILWITSHTQLILELSSCFLLYTAFITILVCISAKTNIHNYVRLKHLNDFLSLIYSYFLLLVQILHNLGFFQYGIWKLTKYYFSHCVTIKDTIVILMYIFQLLAFCDIIISYFYFSGETSTL